MVKRRAATQEGAAAERRPRRKEALVRACRARMPRGDFEFEDSVADSIRAKARDVVGEDLAESFQSGMYSENALVSTESLTPDQLAEWADFWESGA